LLGCTRNKRSRMSAAVRSRSRVVIQDGGIRLGRWLAVGFHRTLRVPDDGGSYPLPPTFGRFPIYSCADCDRIPKSWQRASSFFIPVYQSEALWLGFGGAAWHPAALMIAADGVNVITGEPWNAPLAGTPQNYLVVPDQPWLDGIRTHGGLVRQFVAMPLGEGFTLAEQLPRRGMKRGIQLRAHEAKPGRFADEAPPMGGDFDQPRIMRSPDLRPGMGVGAGGNIVQKIYPDRHGFDCWEGKEADRAQVYLVNSAQFSWITGQAPPPPLISAADYTKIGLPWFKLWDAELGDLGSQSVLEVVKSIGDIAAAIGSSSEDPTVHIPENQIKEIRPVKPDRRPRR
jgi:hypothetical protein